MLDRDHQRALEALVVICYSGPVSAWAVAAALNATERHARATLEELERLGYATMTPESVYAGWLARDVDGWEPTDEGRGLNVVR